MTDDERSIDDALGYEIDLGGGRGSVSRAEAVRAPAPVHQQTLDGREEPVQKPRMVTAGFIAAVVFRSRSGSDRPHIVTVLTFPEQKREVVCTCDAMLSLVKRPEGCWAMQYVRDLIGIVPPGGPA